MAALAMMLIRPSPKLPIRSEPATRPRALGQSRALPSASPMSRSTLWLHASMWPSSVAKMNAAGGLTVPLLRTNSVPVLATWPLGARDRGRRQRITPRVLQIGVGHRRHAGYVGGQVDLLQRHVLPRRARGGARRTKPLEHYTSLFGRDSFSWRCNRIWADRADLTLGTPSSRGYPQRLLVLVPDLIATQASWLGEAGQARMPPSAGGAGAGDAGGGVAEKDGAVRQDHGS